MGRKAANHTAMCVPMQQSYMFFTCTLKPKMQLKKKDCLLEKVSPITTGGQRTSDARMLVLLLGLNQYTSNFQTAA